MSNNHYLVGLAYNLGLLVNKEDFLALTDILERAEFATKEYGTLKMSTEFPDIKLHLISDQEIAIAKTEEVLDG